jgi:hypothetical protein
MTHHELGTESSDQASKPFDLIRDAWSELLSRKKQALYDENAPNKTARVGTRRSGISLAGGSLEVVRFNARYVPRIQALLRENIGIDLENLIGHVDFDFPEKVSDEPDQDRPATRIGGAVYLMEDGKATASVTCNIGEGQALSTDSDACYDFAEGIGLAASWRRAEHAATPSAPLYFQEAVSLSQTAQYQLGTSLQGIKRS